LNYKELHEKLKLPYFLVFALISLSALFFLYSGKNLIFIALFSIPVLLIVLIYFEKYFIYYFIVTLFLKNYLFWDLRIMPVSLVSYAMIFFFITAYDSGYFSKLSLPKTVRNSAVIFIIAVFVSEINSPHVSFQSVYFGFIMLSMILTFYVVFRTIKTTENLENLLNFFVFFTFITGVLIILQIIYTGRLRSFVYAGIGFADYCAFAMITLVFSYFIFGKPKLKIYIIFGVISIVIVTSLTRTMWISLAVSLVYGLIISALYDKDRRAFIKQKFSFFVFVSIIVIILFIAFGLFNIITSRLSDFSTNLFQFDSDSETLVSNSLESRIFIWIVAGNAFLSNPVTGVGYLMFSEVSSNYNILPDFIFDIFVKNLDAHTTYLNFLTETGIVGFLSFITFLVVIYRLTFKSIKLSKTISEKKVSVILNIYLFFIILHSIYSGAFTLAQIAYLLYYLLALAVANYSILKYKYLERDFTTNLN
jgi:O-antigen ligase